MLRFARLFLILVLLPLLLPLENAVTQVPDGLWHTLGQPVAYVTHIAADPDTPEFLVVAVAHAVHRNNDRTQASTGSEQRAWALYFSNDGGDSWQPASNDLADAEITFLQVAEGVAGNTVWAGTASKGLWRSENGGRTWRPAFIIGLDNQRTMALTVDTRQRLHLLTMENNRYPAYHLYSSDDNGYNWNHRLLQEYNDDPATTPVDLIADPFDANRLYAVTQGGLLYSDDVGFSWNRSPLPVPANALPGGDTVISADPTQRGRLYLVNRKDLIDGSSAMVVARSLDSAASWEALPSTLTWPTGANAGAVIRPQSLRQDPLDRRQLFLVTNNGLWQSRDAGLSWRLAGSALAGVSINDLFLHPHTRGKWLAAGAGGIWRTANAGSQWRPISEGLPPSSQIISLLTPDKSIPHLLALNGGGMLLPDAHHPLWRSTDGGESWMPAMLGIEGVNLLQLAAHATEANVVYGRTSSGIAASNDGGRRWRFTKLPTAPNDVVAGDDPDLVFASSLDGVWRSLDQGEKWERTSLQTAVQKIAVSSDGTVYAIGVDVGDQRRVFRSSNQGDSWQIVGQPPQGIVNSLLAHPSRAETLLMLLQWDGLFVSEDGGVNWQRRDDGIPSGVRWRLGQPETPAGPNLLALFVDDADVWWAGRDSGGVYQSKDNGLSWRNLSADIGDTLVRSFSEDGESVLAGSSNLGVLRHLIQTSDQTPPADVDVRIEILWPHAAAAVESASLANIGLRVYESRSQEVPPCAWTPNVELWVARDAEPLQRLAVAHQRTVEGHTFPFWEVNDVDVTWANDPAHKLIYLARVSPNLADSSASPWIHAADARTILPVPPEPDGLSAGVPEAIDAYIRIVWPHDSDGKYAPPERANLVNISAILVERDSMLVLAPEHNPERVWLVGSLDNQVGRRLAVGEPRTINKDGFDYTVYDFNNIDVNLARDSEHHWTFWIEATGIDTASNVWVHGIDNRTRAPDLLEPIAGCRP